MAAALQARVENILQELKEHYSKLVRNNPDTVSQIESAVRILSFLVAGRFENGELLSELFYALSNLLVFLHDNIFKAASKYLQNLEFSKVLVQRWLTVIEYLEVFIEMAARKRWGEYGAWLFIAAIQITKTVLRFVLLLKMDAGIQTTPPIGRVDRELLKAAMEEEHDNLEDAWDELNAKTAQEKTFTLQSSGRQIRTLQAAKHDGSRRWSAPHEDDTKPQNGIINQKRRLLNQPSTRLTKYRLMGEILHIAKPVAHSVMYMFGQTSWKPWLLSLGMDLSSVKLMGDVKELNPKERAELKRRNLMLLYYLMRSPFYSNYTKARLTAVLGFIGAHVPLSGFLTRPVLDYLPTWQKMYFYVWAT